MKLLKVIGVVRNFFLVSFIHPSKIINDVIIANNIAAYEK